MKRSVLLMATAVLAASFAPASATPDRAEGLAEGLKPVAAIEYEGGTHLAFTTVKRHDYALAVQGMWGTNDDGVLRSIDITNPEHPVVADAIDCGYNQGYLDISHDDKTLLVGSDSDSWEGKDCPAPGLGFMTVDISNPKKMEVLGFAPVARGSHGVTAHPTKPIVYNSYGDVVANEPAAFEIWSIDDPRKPKLLSYVSVPGYHGPHDMTFSPDGNLMVASNVSTLQVFDVRDPKNPVLLSTTQCPGCIHTHESRFTPDGKRLIVTDESLAGPNPCPGGGLYFYDVADGGELTLTGAFQPQDVVMPEGRSAPVFCTSHVIGLSADGTKVAASWHGAGVRYIDISGTSGVGFGDQGASDGPRELGFFVAPDSDAMSAKFYKGPYIYSNDASRGFEVFKITR